MSILALEVGEAISAEMGAATHFDQSRGHHSWTFQSLLGVSAGESGDRFLLSSENEVAESVTLSEQHPWAPMRWAG